MIRPVIALSLFLMLATPVMAEEFGWYQVRVRETDSCTHIYYGLISQEQLHAGTSPTTLWCPAILLENQAIPYCPHTFAPFANQCGVTKKSCENKNGHNVLLFTWNQDIVNHPVEKSDKVFHFLTHELCRSNNY